MQRVRAAALLVALIRRGSRHREVQRAVVDLLVTASRRSIPTVRLRPHGVGDEVAAAAALGIGAGGLALAAGCRAALGGHFAVKVSDLVGVVVEVSLK